MEAMSDTVTSLLNRSLDDIIAESRTASRKAPGGKAKAPRAPRGAAPSASPAAAAVAPADPCAVRVNNLAWTVTQDALTAFMSSAGTVVSTVIPLNTAGKSKGHALVTYETVASALQAVQTLNDVELDGRKVILRQDKPKAPAVAAPAPAGRPAPAPSSASVYVGNIAFSVTAEALTSHLNTVGKVVSVSLSRGWALARYSSPKGAAAAIARLTDTEIDGRKIFVREDRETPSAGAGAPPRAAKAAASAGTVTVVKPVAGPSIAVSGLPYDITAEELRGIFASVGATQATLAGKGSGVVGFRAPASANRAAAEFNGALVNGRAITVRVK